MDINRYRRGLHIVTITIVSLLMGCAATPRSLMQNIPQLNNVRIIERNGSPDDDRKIWVFLEAPELSQKDYNEWRAKCIPDALKNAGINNYKVAALKIQELQSSDIGGDYLLVIFLNNFKTTEVITDAGPVTSLWLSLTASVYDFPLKRLVVKLGGSATDTASLGVLNAGEMCESLLREMMKKMQLT